MRYTQFRIRNFKGISDATLQLSPRGANIFTLIGLNESGKTSILEAINAFKPDENQKTLFETGKEDSTVLTSYIPKKYQSNFSDSIQIRALVEISTSEIVAIARSVGLKQKCEIDINSIPDTLTITQTFVYEDSEYKRGQFVMDLAPKYRETGVRKYKTASQASDPVWMGVAVAIRDKLPTILYFPTFLFSIPQRIILNPGENEDSLNSIYRNILADVAHSLPNKLDLEKHVVNRMIGKGGGTTKTKTGVVVIGGDKQLQAAAALNDISVNISNMVFAEWRKVLGTDVRGREISLRPGIEISKDDAITVFVQFMMKDGNNTYDMSERSLGFRWFFSFLLFTIYRAGSRAGKEYVFLLDEPASNLHAKAQTQLLESFPKIARDGSALIYSTHSHYMINPAWLDQASIVVNAAIERAEISEATGVIGNNPTDIVITKYRKFVGENPDRVTYFQPVLDQLDYAPSKLDLLRPALLVEGKGDYVILEAVRKCLLHDPGDFVIVPTRGAAGLSELIGLFLGWSVPFCICLDDDGAGRKACDTYRREWGLRSNRVFTLMEIDATLEGKNIEGLLSNEDVEAISRYLEISTPPSKSQIQLYYSERLARGEVFECSEILKSRVSDLISRVAVDLKRDDLGS